MDFEDNHDTVVPAPLPELIQVSWSRSRCWHGETVTIRVRTQRIPDGSMVRLEVAAQGGAAFHVLPQQALQNDQIDYAYPFDRDSTVIPLNTTDFVVTATAVLLNLTSPPSEPLTVDLRPPLFSA